MNKAIGTCNRYPIYRDYDQKEIVGWVELDTDTDFKMLDILAPEVINAIDGLKGVREKGLRILSFGLISGNHYLKQPEKTYGNLKDLKDKNVNI